MNETRIIMQYSQISAKGLDEGMKGACHYAFDAIETYCKDLSNFWFKLGMIISVMIILDHWIGKKIDHDFSFEAKHPITQLPITLIFNPRWFLRRITYLMSLYFIVFKIVMWYYT